MDLKICNIRFDCKINSQRPRRPAKGQDGRPKAQTAKDFKFFKKIKTKELKQIIEFINLDELRGKRFYGKDDYKNRQIFSQVQCVAANCGKHLKAPPAL